MQESKCDVKRLTGNALERVAPSTCARWPAASSGRGTASPSPAAPCGDPAGWSSPAPCPGACAGASTGMHLPKTSTAAQIRRFGARREFACFVLDLVQLAFERAVVLIHGRRKPKTRCPSDARSARTRARAVARPRRATRTDDWRWECCVRQDHCGRPFLPPPRCEWVGFVACCSGARPKLTANLRGSSNAVARRGVARMLPGIVRPCRFVMCAACGAARAPAERARRHRA